MWKALLLVGAGGFVGSILRYLTGLWLTKDGQATAAFPAGTFAANVLGCLLIGVLFGLAHRYQWPTPQWRLLLVTGFCGGYTTFSTFSYENIKLLMEANYQAFALYTASSLVSGLLAVAAGMMLTRIF